MFQSLLFWIIGSGLAKAAERCGLELFQSLLFWIIGSGCAESGAQDAVIASFNPCCFGSLVRAVFLAVIVTSNSLFQSLLFWIIGSGVGVEKLSAPD